MEKAQAIEKYQILVNFGEYERTYEISRGTERMQEIVPILENLYGVGNVRAVKLRKNSNLYKYH